MSSINIIDTSDSFCCVNPPFLTFKVTSWGEVQPDSAMLLPILKLVRILKTGVLLSNGSDWLEDSIIIMSLPLAIAENRNEAISFKLRSSLWATMVTDGEIEDVFLLL